MRPVVIGSALFSVFVASSTLAQTAGSVPAGEPLPDCHASVGYDRNQELPGYRVPNSKGGQVCVPFLASRYRAPDGFDANFHIDEFTDEKLKARWADCKADAACLARLKPQLDRWVPPNKARSTRVTGTVDPVGKIDSEGDVDLRQIRRPAFFAKAPYREAIAEAEPRTWIVEFTAPHDAFERLKLNMTGTIKLRGWYMEGAGVPDDVGHRTRALIVISAGGGGQITAIENLADGRVNHGPDGTPLTFPGVLIDVGERRALIQQRDHALTELRDLNDTLELRIKDRTDELMVAEEQLRQSQKMEAVGQLTGGVAHDFNNLLTVIKSSSDLLKRPNLTEERRDRYVGAISDTVDRAAKLTGQLLAFARRQALKPEVFDACESLRQLADMMGTLTGSRVQVVTELPDSPCFVNADPSQFDTALVNMAVNARDAMDGQGRLTIAVTTIDSLPAIRTHPAQDGPYVAVSITDTGMGIAAGQLEHIFEPFFTTKEIGKGTGLGLSQVFGFAKQSEGEIVVASTLGEGTTFTLYLRGVAAPAERTGIEIASSLVDGCGTRVLVVEDNADVGTFTTQSLNDLGYITVLAADGAAALAELARDADRFDVVFTDVVMPGIGGIELGQEVRRLYHDLPVVLTSGYSHVLAENGTFGFDLLNKPYSIEQLSQMLNKVVTWQRRKRLLEL